MDTAAIEQRLAALLSDSSGTTRLELQNRLNSGTLTLLQVLYGPDSSQERALRTALEEVTKKLRADTGHAVSACISIIRGVLLSMQSEVTAGFVGSLRASITGDVLAELLKLARVVLEDSSDGAKNVGAVLAAAAFEDCLRRLAALKGLPHADSLADTLTALKDSAVLKGAQVGIAQSYLSFRNRALHAKWPELDRPEVLSVLAFVEALLVKHFE